MSAFDKHTVREFKTRPNNLAAKTAFYDIEVPEGIVSIEESLSEMERLAARAIRKIRDAEALHVLNLHEVAVMAAFIAIQHLRTQHFRERIANMDQQLRAALRLTGDDSEQVSNYRPFGSVEEVKEFSGLFQQLSASHPPP